MSETLLRPGQPGASVLSLVVVRAALADGSWAHSLNPGAGSQWSGLAGGVLDNTTGGAAFLEMDLDIPAGFTAGSGAPAVQVHVLRSLNAAGTQWPAPPGPGFGTADALPPTGYWVGNIFLVPSAANTHQQLARLVPLGPWRYAFSLRNAAGQSLPVNTTLRGRTSGLIAV